MEPPNLCIIKPRPVIIPINFKNSRFKERIVNVSDIVAKKIRAYGLLAAVRI